MEVSLPINQLMYCNRPKNPLISFLHLGGGISNMALIFDRSTSIPSSYSKGTFLWIQPQSMFHDPFKELPQIDYMAFSIFRL